VVVLDDLGFAQLGCFGSSFATPHIDQLADGGLRYNRFHVTAVCSATRASLLTGRNHHAVGVGLLVDVPLAFPGYTGSIPRSAAALPRILRDAGYNTLAVGKWHLTPRGERSAAGPFDRWPVGMGFERYYGFLGGETNQWAPNLVSDNHQVDPPGRPEDGYHLTEDLTDAAIRMVTDQHHAAPDKPFFLYYAPGAVHAPHQVSSEWVEPYRGQFDDGWDRWREAAFARQLELGVVPAGTKLTERPPWVSAWDDLGDDAHRMHTRALEVFAGFLTHTDAQIGRLVAALGALGVLDNTLLLVLSDNGASAEGGQHGTFNEHRFMGRLTESVEKNSERLADWGGHRSFGLYSWAWGWAGNTPFRLWKRYTWLGGTRTPLVVHWPAGIGGRGEVRSQFAHAVDVLPTVLDACGVPAPDVVDGVSQQRLDGASLRPSFDDAAAPGRRTQYFELLGSRSIVHDRWKATTDHVPRGFPDEEELLIGSRDFAADHWALFDLDEDFSEAVDVSDRHADVVDRMRELWLAEAGRNNVLPLADDLASRFASAIPRDHPPPNRVVFRSGASPISDEAVPPLIGGFRVAVDAEVAEGGPEGILVAAGDWNGGWAFYAAERALHFTLCPYGEPTTVAGTARLTLGRHELVAAFTPINSVAATVSLTCDGVVVAESSVKGPWQFGNWDLRIGHDGGFPVCDDYTPPFPWCGTIHTVTLDASETVRRSDPDPREALHHD
jgi:arylsulfatase